MILYHRNVTSAAVRAVMTAVAAVMTDLTAVMPAVAVVMTAVVTTASPSLRGRPRRHQDALHYAGKCLRILSQKTSTLLNANRI